MRTFPILIDFYQICYVTADLDAGMKQLAAMHGVERFRIKRDVKSLPGMPAMRMNQAHVYVGPVQIELIQPAGGDDALYRDFCAADGRSLRFHHYAMWVDDPAEFEGLLPALKVQNVPVAFASTIPNIGKVIYADLRSALGHYVEYVHLIPEVKRTYYADVPHYEGAVTR
jgi:hypothetical protein